MTPSPFFKFFLFLCPLIPAIGKDIQELYCRHLPHLIPGASASLRHKVYIRNPTPLFSKSSCSCIFLKVFLLISLSGIFIASSLQEVRESLIN